MQTLVRGDEQSGLGKLSVSGRGQTPLHTQSCSVRCKAASTACIGCQTRQNRTGRVRVCRGIYGSSPRCSSLWEAAGDEAHLHTDSLPQPRETPLPLSDGWGPKVFRYTPVSPRGNSVRLVAGKSQQTQESLRTGTSSALLQGRSHLESDPECTVGAARLS